MNEIWLHIDVNAYFATLLQQEIPSLRGKPVGIVKEEGRTCLIATSKEAKKLGIKTGTRLKEALDICPKLVVAPARFGAYLAATKRLYQVFRSVSPDVEVFSLDEAFILWNPIRNLHPNPVTLGKLLQQRLYGELGEWVSCNVGIGANRLIAKMTGETSPKGSVVWTKAEDEAVLLARTSFADVCGVGRNLERQLQKLGVRVPYQLNFISDGDLQQVVGPFWAQELRKIGQGLEPAMLARGDKSAELPKSVSRSITGWKACDDEAVIKATLYNLVLECIAKVRKMKLAGRFVAVSLWGEGQSWSKHLTLSHHTVHTKEMFELIYYNLYKVWRRDFRVIKFGVYLGMLTPMSQTMPELWESWQQTEKVETALTAINERYGLFTATSGILLKQARINPEVTGFFGDKHYQLAHG